MTKAKEKKPVQQREYLALYAVLAIPTFLLAVNVHDSSILKLPALILCSTLLVCIAITSSMRNGTLRIVVSPVLMCTLIFILIALASFLFQHNPKSNEALWMVLTQAICLYAGMSLGTTRAETTRIIRVLAVITGLVALGGIIQYFWSDILPIEFYLGKDRRVGSTLGNPSFLSGFLVLVCPIILSHTLDKNISVKEKRWCMLLCAIVVFLILITKTRSSILAFGISMSLFALLMVEKQKTKAIVIASVIAIAIVAAFVFSPALQQRFLLALDTGPTSTFARRLFFWEAGIKAFLASPVAGHGIGSFESTMMSFRSPDYWKVRSEDIVPHAHNEVIETGVELGVIGILLLGIILYSAFASGIRASRSENRWQHVTAIGILCGVAGLLIDNLANVSLRQSSVAATMWLCLGLLLSESLTGKPLRTLTYPLRQTKKVSWVPLIIWICLAVPYILSELKLVKANSFLIKGVLAASTGNSAPALRAYEQAITLDSTSYLISSNYAVELVRTSQFVKGLAILDHIESRYPHYPKNGLMEAVALYSLNRSEEALAAIERELTRRNHPESYHVQSMIYRQLGDTVREKAALKRAVDQCIYGKTSIEFQSLLGRLFEVSSTREELDSLRTMSIRLFDTFPDNQIVRSHLARVYNSLGDSTRAAELLSDPK